MDSAQTGGVIAAVIVLLLSITLVFWYCRKYGRNDGLGENGTTDTTAMAAIRSRSQSKNSQTSAATTPKSSITATAAIEKKYDMGTASLRNSRSIGLNDKAIRNDPVVQTDNKNSKQDIQRVTSRQSMGGGAQNEADDKQGTSTADHSFEEYNQKHSQSNGNASSANSEDQRAQDADSQSGEEEVYDQQRLDNMTVDLSGTTYATTTIGLSLPGFLYADRRCFALAQKIGQGGYGSIHLAEGRIARLQEFGRIIVAKKFAESEAELDAHKKLLFMQEVSIFYALHREEHIAKILGFCFSPVCILLKFYSLGSLDALIHSKKWGSIKKRYSMLMDIAKGIKSIHAQDLAHCDIKPHNVLVERLQKGYRCVLTDFGISHVLSAKLLNVKHFTIINKNGCSFRYASPETFMRCHGAKIPQVRESDIYSLAVVLNEMATKVVPCLKTGAIIILLLAVIGYAASLSTLIANPKDIFSIAIAVLGVVLALVGLIGSIYENPGVVQFIATVYLVYLVVSLGNVAYALVHVFSSEWYDNCSKELDKSASMGCDDVRNISATIVGVAGGIQFLISFLIIWVLFSYYRELKRGYARIPVRHVHFNDA